MKKNLLFEDPWRPFASWDTLLGGGLKHKKIFPPRTLGKVIHLDLRINLLLLGAAERNTTKFIEFGELCLEYHPSTRKCLITMVIVSPLRIGLWDPFQMAEVHGWHKWGWSEPLTSPGVILQVGTFFPQEIFVDHRWRSLSDPPLKRVTYSHHPKEVTTAESPGIYYI